MISIHHCVVQNEAAAACGYEFNISRQPRSQKSFMGQTRNLLLGLKCYSEGRYVGPFKAHNSALVSPFREMKSRNLLWILAGLSTLIFINLYFI